MNKLKSDRNIWLFFLITFIFSWLLWLPFVLWGLNVIELSQPVASLMTPAVMLGAFGPMIAALALIKLKEGKGAAKKFLRNAFDFRVKQIYYILAFVLPLLATAVAHYITNFLGLDILPANLFPENLAIPVVALIIPYFLLIFIAGGGQEEFGWRGYAQEPLQQRFGILKASVLIGVVWGVWHLPLWFMPGEGHAYYSFFAFLLYTVSTSVSIGWLYNAGSRKLIIPLIIHTMGNVSVPFFPIMHMADVPQPGVGVNAIMAILLSIWFTMKSKKLSA